MGRKKTHKINPNSNLNAFVIVACCSWPKTKNTKKNTFGCQMERIFSGAWKDKHGKTRTNAENVEESTFDPHSNGTEKRQEEVNILPSLFLLLEIGREMHVV